VTRSTLLVALLSIAIGPACKTATEDAARSASDETARGTRAAAPTDATDRSADAIASEILDGSVLSRFEPIEEFARREAPRVRDASSGLGLVVSADHVASEVGARILARGGNAIDAAVALAFTLAVTYPRAGNLGGGGFMLVHTADGRDLMIDYRETAPATATPDMYLTESGEVHPTRSILGYAAAGVPGTVPGLALAHRELGTLPWEDLVRPAARLALKGFRMDEDLSRSIERAADDFRRFPASARVFLGDDGEAPAPGSIWTQPDLGRTLATIASQGASAMTEGSIGRRLAAEVEKHGGFLRTSDLAAYRPVLREAVHATYRGHEIVGPPLPSSGGITLVRMLRFLDALPPIEAGPNDPATIHRMAEAMRRAYRDRAAWLGDTDFVDVDVARLLAADHVSAWMASFDPGAATPSESIAGAIPLAPEGPETTHFSVVDSAGNAVANTYTLNYSFGCKAVAAGTGILLNNEMDDFNLRPGTTDRDGRIGTEPNVVAPAKRMLSSMTPLIVLRDGRPVLVTGSPGGRTIINTVLRVVTGILDHGLPLREAVDAPRFHHGWFPDVLRVERGRFPKATLERLGALGHEIESVEFQGDAHSIVWDPARRAWAGVADRRIDGAVGVPDRP